METIVISAFGWTGSAFIILAYALTLVEKYKDSDLGTYLNLAGGVFIAVNCYYNNAIPSFATNLIWSVIATFTIFKAKFDLRPKRLLKTVENKNR